LTPLACGWSPGADERFWRRRARRARAARVVREYATAALHDLLTGVLIAWGALAAVWLWVQLGLPVFGLLERVQ